MFQTVDAMSGGRFFWQSLEKLRRPPYDCVLSGRSATLFDPSQGLALILAPSDDIEPEADRRVFVQLRDVPNGEVLLDATLNTNYQYLCGEALGVSSDELAATEALAMYMPDLRGEWVITEGGDDEDEQHG